MLATACCLQAAIISRKTPNDQSHVTTSQRLNCYRNRSH